MLDIPKPNKTRQKSEKKWEIPFIPMGFTPHVKMFNLKKLVFFLGFMGLMGFPYGFSLWIFPMDFPYGFWLVVSPSPETFHPS